MAAISPMHHSTLPTRDSSLSHAIPCPPLVILLSSDMSSRWRPLQYKWLSIFVMSSSNDDMCLFLLHLLPSSSIPQSIASMLGCLLAALSLCYSLEVQMWTDNVQTCKCTCLRLTLKEVVHIHQLGSILLPQLP
jgi:hypothetical protein